MRMEMFFSDGQLSSAAESQVSIGCNALEAMKGMETTTLETTKCMETTTLEITKDVEMMKGVERMKDAEVTIR